MSVCFVCFMLDCVGELLVNVFAICVGEVNVFSLKVMFFLLVNPCIVFQRLCMFCL